MVGLTEYKPRNLARVGSFEGNLEVAVAKFSLDFIKKPTQQNIQAYTFLNSEPYIMTLIHEQRQLKSAQDYNTLLLLISGSHKRNMDLVNEIQEKTKINFERTIPTETQPQFKIYELMFKILSEKPEESIKFLKELVQGTVRL